MGKTTKALIMLVGLMGFYTAANAYTMTETVCKTFTPLWDDNLHYYDHPSGGSYLNFQADFSVGTFFREAVAANKGDAHIAISSRGKMFASSDFCTTIYEGRGLGLAIGTFGSRPGLPDGCDGVFVEDFTASNNPSPDPDGYYTYVGGQPYFNPDIQVASACVPFSALPSAYKETLSDGKVYPKWSKIFDLRINHSANSLTWEWRDSSTGDVVLSGACNPSMNSCKHSSADVGYEDVFALGVVQQKQALWHFDLTNHSDGTQ